MKLYKHLMLKQKSLSTISIQIMYIVVHVWTTAGTLDGSGRIKFDAWFRKLVNGEDKSNPKPKSVTVTKAQLFPERFTVFDYYWDPQRNNGTWVLWIDMVDKIQQIPLNAKVLLEI